MKAGAVGCARDAKIYSVVDPPGIAANRARSDPRRRSITPITPSQNDRQPQDGVYYVLPCVELTRRMR